MSFFKKMISGNRFTAFMLLFVILLYTFLAIASWTYHPKPGSSNGSAVSSSLTAKELKDKEEVVRKKLVESPSLMNLVTLLFLGALVWGILLDLLLWDKARKGRAWIVREIPSANVSWDVGDVFQALLFLFFIEGCLFLLQLTAHWLTKIEVPQDILLLCNSLLRDVSVAIFVLLIVGRKHGRPFSDLGLRNEKIFSFMKLGLAAYIAIVPTLIICFTVLGLALSAFSYEPAPQNVVQMYLKPSSENFLIFFTVFVAVFGPILEEIFFRGFAYAALRKRLGFWGAAALTSAVFAAFHLNWVVFTPIFLLGMFLCYLYESTGSLVPSISAHILHNTIMVMMTLGFRSLSR